MANITGTEGADTLRGTNIDPLAPPRDFSSGSDTISALGGNDLIIGSTGNDQIDGGAGNDTLDFSNIGRDLFLSDSGSYIDTVDFQRRVRPDPTENFITTSVSNIETFIGDPSKSNTINDFTRSTLPSPTRPIDVDLVTGRVVLGSTTYTVKNFDNIVLPFSSGKLISNDRDNRIFGGNSSIITASKGNDSLSAGTVDYSKIGNTINVLAELVYSPGSGRAPFESVTATNTTIEKGGAGKDKVSRASKIIGAINKNNTLNVSSSRDVSVNINLATNLLSGSETSKNPSTAKVLLKTEIINFTNAVGTNNNDIIVGANKKGKLTGGGGSDTVTGGNKNDILTGSDSTARGVGEVDTLTGGGGQDKFVLGDKNGAYYVGKGKDDYATITDFNLFQDSIDLGGFKNYSFAATGDNSIELYSGKDVNTRDLIAKIQLAGGISNRNTNSRSMMGDDVSLNAITSKLDILSGSSSNTDV
jgi:Ca2+-binding RTX toxin-like protein